MYRGAIRGLDRNLALVLIITLCYTIGSSSVMFLFPLIGDNLFGNLLLLGVLIGFSGLVSMFFAVPFGSLSSHIGRKGTLGVGLLLGLFLSYSLFNTKDFFSYVVMMFLAGLVNAAVTVSLRSFVMDICPVGMSSRYFAVYTTAMSIGFVLGPLLAGGFLDSGLSYCVQNVSFLFAGVCVLAFVFSLFLNESVKDVKGLGEGVRHLVYKDGFMVKGFSDFRKLGGAGLFVLFITVLLSTTDRVVWTMEPLYYGLGIPAVYVGVIMAMFIVPYVLFELPAGFLADKFGRRKILGIGLFVSGLSLIAFGFSKDVVLLALFAFLSTTGFALVWPSISGLLTEISGKNEKGGIVGVWNSSEDLGFTLGPFIAGFSAYYLNSISAPFVLIGLIVLFSFVVFSFVGGKR